MGTLETPLYIVMTCTWTPWPWPLILPLVSIWAITCPASQEKFLSMWRLLTHFWTIISASTPQPRWPQTLVLLVKNDVNTIQFLHPSSRVSYWIRFFCPWCWCIGKVVPYLLLLVVAYAYKLGLLISWVHVWRLCTSISIRWELKADTPRALLNHWRRSSLRLNFLIRRIPFLLCCTCNWYRVTDVSRLFVSGHPRTANITVYVVRYLYVNEIILMCIQVFQTSQ